MRVEHIRSAERDSVVVEHQAFTYGRIDEIERNLACAARPVNPRKSLQRVGRWLHSSLALVGVLLQRKCPHRACYPAAMRGC